MTTRHSYTCFAQRSTFGAVAALFWLTATFGQVSDAHAQFLEQDGPQIPVTEDPLIAQSLNEGRFGGSMAYEICLSAVEADPTEGFERAMIWGDQGGGPPADHCGALALLGLGLYAEAADRLDTMAQDTTNGLGAEIRAELLIQAANAWMFEGFPRQALESLRAAEALEPAGTRLRMELHFDRARALIMDGDWQPAMDSLNQALTIAPQAKDALVLRATGYRVLGENDLAQADLTRVLADDPDYFPAYVERGVLWRVMGDDEAARADWIRVLINEPEGELANAARSHLHNLDFPNGLEAPEELEASAELEASED